MNLIPHDGAMPTGPFFGNGYPGVLLLLTIASLFVVFGMMLWALRRVTRERKRLLCPVRLRSVRVLFRLAPDGARTEVLRCSVFGRRPITCGQVCLHPTPVS